MILLKGFVRLHFWKQRSPFSGYARSQNALETLVDEIALLLLEKEQLMAPKMRLVTMMRMQTKQPKDIIFTF